MIEIKWALQLLWSRKIIIKGNFIVKCKMILTLNRNKTEGEEANQNLKMTVIRI